MKVYDGRFRGREDDIVYIGGVAPSGREKVI